MRQQINYIISIPIILYIDYPKEISIIAHELNHLTQLKYKWDKF